ncbi:protein-L-isoaspartate(D-aspartate) O-methyltransferase [Salinivirga cyanobacteriivorans]|uniref:Protein-L-isoaspartate O-methyltransferase n=1 Tax=Salinivirga cyanobacteriivorans TaxID=1307839 RepID=A0A0S2I1R1_9BACT|nr:protein-L-isoaspartate(D-aspartate) O-methyltransferase [Salinivirga cyanobacteriivorans]ALO16171.1 Protein-L-isoaspartate O-methyltransferase [Salinivirga cyanobacteriivorans]
MEDTYRHKGMRNQLVKQIAHKGISDEKVLEAVRAVPRHFFFDSAFTEHAYDDKPFPIGSGQTISQPFTVAFQTQLLEVQPGDKILEIGTGSGYQAAILAAMRARVYTIERHRDLYKKSQQIIDKMGFKRIQFFLGDGYEGKEAYSPYDKIIITCGAPFMPEKVLDQLKPGGYIVAPIGEGSIQEMQRWEKQKDGEFVKSSYGNFSFVPMIKGKH